MNISWYINRLKTMSVGELVFRAEQLAYRKFSKQFYTGLRPTVKLNSLPTKLLTLEDEFFQSLQIDESSSFKILGLDWDYGLEHDWHLDIRSGGIFPKVFCRNVNTRSDEFGIAKYVWEPNRHQFLTRICYQFRKTGDDKWLGLFMMHLRSWYQDNPYLIGVNWYSNIEVNLRLINWFLCWEILDLNTLMEERQDVKSFVEECFTPLIYLHCKYSHNYPSKYSSANNHRIAEGVGLFIASSYWNFPESEAWNKSARKIVELEMVAQHAASGINREETSEYIQFITDYFLVSKVVADRTGKPFTDRYESYLHNAIRYVYELMDCKGGINHYGDADNGRTFILEEDPEHFNNFKSLMVSGAMLYHDEELKSAAGNWDTKNQVLFSNDGKHTFNKVASSAKVHASQFYPNEGRYIFRKRDEEKEILMNFNAAPLGFLSIAAHGHADALSFSLSVDGFPVLVDTGTFSYHTDMPWRNYFKGTLAHNSIRIDEVNQAQIGGPTLWKDHYTCNTENISVEPNLELVRASHNGYERLGVSHTRTLSFDRSSSIVVVQDSVKVLDDKSHLVEFPLHFHPDLQIEKITGTEYHVSRDGMRKLRILLDAAFTTKHYTGSEEPILGWFSPDFYVKYPSLSVLQSTKTSVDLNVKMEISILP